MKTIFDHLPEEKQQDLKQAVDIIREKVNPELLILFGSYARGDWVEDLDPDTLHYRYQSDMDLLVVTETRKEAENIQLNDTLDQILMRRIRRTPILTFRMRPMALKSRISIARPSIHYLTLTPHLKYNR
ncbi:MAG: nucleotidyltransferase domain-containing protein [Candidatus Margulisbacteria bacterium]|nr:nucleotidyltransferase domain-containing protein [Candidatus Margulisiibacteriota bacterium]